MIRAQRYFEKSYNYFLLKLIPSILANFLGMPGVANGFTKVFSVAKVRAGTTMKVAKKMKNVTGKLKNMVGGKNIIKPIEEGEKKPITPKTLEPELEIPELEEICKKSSSYKLIFSCFMLPIKFSLKTFRILKVPGFRNRHFWTSIIDKRDYNETMIKNEDSDQQHSPQIHSPNKNVIQNINKVESPENKKVKISELVANISSGNEEQEISKNNVRGVFKHIISSATDKLTGDSSKISLTDLGKAVSDNSLNNI
jgi:hypothetical protein